MALNYCATYFRFFFFEASVGDDLAALNVRRCSDKSFPAFALVHPKPRFMFSHPSVSDDLEMGVLLPGQIRGTAIKFHQRQFDSITRMGF